MEKTKHLCSTCPISAFCLSLGGMPRPAEVILMCGGCGFVYLLDTFFEYDIQVRVNCRDTAVFTERRCNACVQERYLETKKRIVEET